MSLLVSIIIPTCNRAQLLDETLENVRNQSYTNWECIVVDDGDDRSTTELLQKYIALDRRFQYFKRPDNLLKGANSCRNYGFEKSKGEYVNWLDDDDLFSENKIMAQYQLLEASKADVATCKWGRFKNECKFVTKNLEIYRDYDRGSDLLQDYGETNSFFPSHAFMIKREVIERSGLWKEGLTINQDGEFFCRVLINARGIVCATNCNVQYRLPASENTSTIQHEIKAKDLIESWQIISENLKAIHQTRFDAYLKNSKDYIFNRLKGEYIDLLKEHREFFKDQFKEASLFSRIKNKLF